MSDIITHLWSSTLVLLIALIVVRVVPLTARTRYVVLFCGLLKFAIPSEMITVPLRSMGRPSTATISMEWLGGPTALRALAPEPASRWPEALITGWILSALALALAWLIARRRLVTSALNAASAASPREHAALAAARRRLRLLTSVDVTRSTICEAPAVVRIIRPVVVLPDGGCDALDDAELESLMRHECAHVARRDNLLGIVESAIVAAFWFHPLVWIAQRAIATAREEACDETAAATADAVDTYISALTKVCRAVLASRLAGVSCMASAHLKERLNHLMNYETLRKRALSHRFVVILSALAVVVATVGGGLDAVAEVGSNTPFTMKFTVRSGDQPDQLEFFGRISETGTGLVLTRPSVSFKRGSGARIRTEVDDRDIQIDIRDEGAKVVATMRIFEKGIPRQESIYSAVPERSASRDASGSRYTGEPLSMNLKDADIKDVLEKFGQITGAEIRYPKNLVGKVTIQLTDVPWDEAFDLILRQNNLRYELQGKTIVIVRE